MTRIFKQTIISCVYREKLRIVEVLKVRDLTKDPLNQASVSEHFEGSRYLYTVMQYEDGQIKSFYSGGMSDIVVLSNSDFQNGKLKARFDNFRKIAKQKAEAQESGLTPEQDAERLHLNDTANNAKIRVNFYGGQSKVARYGSWANVDGQGILYVLNTGINVFSKLKMNKIQSIYLFDDKDSLAPTDPYQGVINNEAFKIPDYEIEMGYSDAFCDALKNFATGHQKFRFILPNGGFYDKFVTEWGRISGKDIVVTLSVDGTNDSDKIKKFSLGTFKEIIKLDEDDGTTTS